MIKGGIHINIVNIVNERQKLRTCAAECLASSFLLGGSRRVPFWIGVISAVSSGFRIRLLKPPMVGV